MRKISDDKIKQIIETLEKANVAINTLERANNNRMLFTDAKLEIQALSTELQSRYSVKEFKIDEDE